MDIDIVCRIRLTKCTPETSDRRTQACDGRGEWSRQQKDVQ